jgi:heme/copper-type cytochrome/quinol oxidase subunit 2
MFSLSRYFSSTRSGIVYKYLNHGTVIELIWTVSPALVLIAIAFPSFKLLYTLDEVIDPALTVKVTGQPLNFDFPKNLICAPSDKGWVLELKGSEFIFVISPQSFFNLNFINRNVDGLKYNFYLTFFV